MVVNGFEVFTADTKTGLISAFLPVAGLSWGIRLNGPGTVSVKIPTNAKEVAHLNVASVTERQKQSLGVVYQGKILECGPIVTKKFDPEAGLLQVDAEGLWSLLNDRVALNWKQLLAGTKISESSIALTRMTHGSIARELVRSSIQDNPLGSLPIVLPADIPGTRVKTYDGYEAPVLGEALTNLTHAKNGPDIRFRPEFAPTDNRYVRWLLEVGTEEKPYLSQQGDPFFWDGTVEKSGVIGFAAEETGKNLTTRAYQPGAGEGRGRRFGLAQDLGMVNVGYPWTDRVLAGMDVLGEDLLNEYAAQYITVNRGALTSWTVTVSAETAPRLGTYLPGDFARLFIPQDHPIIPGGLAPARIMAIDGDGTDQVKLTFAPVRSI